MAHIFTDLFAKLPVGDVLVLFNRSENLTLDFQNMMEYM